MKTFTNLEDGLKDLAETAVMDALRAVRAYAGVNGDLDGLADYVHAEAEKHDLEISAVCLSGLLKKIT